MSQVTGTIYDILKSGELEASDIINMVYEADNKLKAEKAAEEAAKASAKEIDAARAKVINAMNDYFKVIGIAPENEKEQDIFNSIAKSVFEDVESAALARSSRGKRAAVKPVKEVNDDEKLRRFLKAIMEA